MAEPLLLNRRALEDVRESLADRIREGLREEGRQIRALPAFLQRPLPGVRGTAVVVDTGGTNMRAALVTLDGRGGVTVDRGPFEDVVPTGRRGEVVTAAQFFDAQAALVGKLSPPDGVPVGYCFSYPAEITPEADARLIKWTKGVDIPEVVGTLVGRDLGRALGRYSFEPRQVKVLNDTVAAMLGGAGQQADAGLDGFLGLIAGTGTNMAGFFPLGKIPKLQAPGWDHPEMAVNFESGNFSPPRLTRWDDELDQESDNPGHQRFEKAVSGYYLPFLFQKVLPGQPGFDPEKGSAQLLDLRAGGGEAGRVAGAILARSADLVAAGLAAAIDVCEVSGEMGIVAEGSLFWQEPEFRGRVEGTLAALLEGKARFRVIRVQDANLLGSAYAALM